MDDIYFGILTVSDTCSDGIKSDTSGKKLLEIISEGTLISKSKLIHYDIVPDDMTTIAQVLVKWSNEDKCNVILTTGGTGFSARDITPEATRNVIYKEAPGLMHAMMQESLKVTPLAMLSRGVCGIRKNTLIINLPGSLKGAVECLNFVAASIPHAVQLLRNSTNEVAETHTNLQAHGPKIEPSSNMRRKSKVVPDPIAFRARKSPFPMLEMSEAYKCIDANVEISEIIELSLLDSLGYILAENLTANEPIPPFPASMKDGYAVIAEDGAGPRIVVDAISAGVVSETVLKSGTCAQINTGAPLPKGANVVVQVEDTDLLKYSEDGAKEIEINIKVTPTVGLDVRPVGCDVQKDDLILEIGTELKAVELGLLAGMGKTKAKVFQKPLIGLLSTGNELQQPDEELKPGRIRDTNKITLIALYKQMGFETVDFGICKDIPDDVVMHIERALSKCDVLVSTGGVSMGDKDLLKAILKEDFQATIHFGRVNMKPGKPTTFATCIFDNKKKYIFALPGNPVSATVTSQLFVLRALNKMINKNNFPEVVVQAGHDFKLSTDRPEYHRAYLRWDSEQGPVVTSTGNQISSRLKNLQSADCLLKLPQANAECSVITKGSKIEAILLES